MSLLTYKNWEPQTSLSPSSDGASPAHNLRVTHSHVEQYRGAPITPRPGRSQPAFALNTDPLKGCIGFSELSPEIRLALGRMSQSRQLGANDFVYLQDDEAQYLYFVVSGHIRLSGLMEDGSAVIHAILPAGESFGELGVFEESTYCDMATAIGPTVIACIPIHSFRALSASHPEIGKALARLIAKRYRGYVMLTRDISLKAMSARLAQAVLRLADSLGVRMVHRGRPALILGNAVTQTDLGLMARGSRGNVNRVLKTWERAGWIAMVDRCIVLINRVALEASVMEEC